MIDELPELRGEYVKPLARKPGIVLSKPGSSVCCTFGHDEISYRLQRDSAAFCSDSLIPEAFGRRLPILSFSALDSGRERQQQGQRQTRIY